MPFVSFKCGKYLKPVYQTNLAKIECALHQSTTAPKLCIKNLSAFSLNSAPHQPWKMKYLLKLIIFVSGHVYPGNHEGTRAIGGVVNFESSKFQLRWVEEL